MQPGRSWWISTPAPSPLVPLSLSEAPQGEGAPVAHPGLLLVSSPCIGTPPFLTNCPLPLQAFWNHFSNMLLVPKSLSQHLLVKELKPRLSLSNDDISKVALLKASISNSAISGPKPASAEAKEPEGPSLRGSYCSAQETCRARRWDQHC